MYLCLIYLHTLNNVIMLKINSHIKKHDSLHSPLRITFHIQNTYVDIYKNNNLNFLRNKI